MPAGGNTWLAFCILSPDQIAAFGVIDNLVGEFAGLIGHVPKALDRALSLRKSWRNLVLRWHLSNT
jgi:hypothetical protein